MSVAIIRDPVCLRHTNGSGHPERPERLEALDRVIEQSPHRRRLEDVPARDATRDELEWVHTAGHVTIIEASRGHPFTVLDADTAASPDSYASALRAAGGAMAAVDCVLGDGFPSAFAMVRPPGHHAEADRAMGFCLFNNVAVAAEHARRRHGLERIAILDWDVHHGNGTMHRFYDTPQVLYASLHQYPHYPGTGSPREIGAGAGKGYTVNVALPPGQGDAEYQDAFRNLLIPILRQYAPQLILISAGFDAHEMDPLADMRLSSGAFGGMTRAVQSVALEHRAPIALILEGGYSVGALSEGVASVLDALVDTKTAPSWARTDTEPSPVVTRTLGQLRSLLGPHWSNLDEAHV